MYKRSTAVCFLALLFALTAEAPLLAQAKLPSPVVSRLKKIDGYLKTVESKLKKGTADRNSFDWAIETIGEIKKSYPGSLSHPDVKAADKRIADLGAALTAQEAGKKKQAGVRAAEAASAEKALADWARRLSEYKADTKAGSKGLFGIPTDDVGVIVGEKPNYERAKVLYADFLNSGLNKDDHPDLRQAEYDVKMAILNYEKSRERIPEKATAELDSALEWMNARKKEGKTAALSRDVAGRIALLIEQTNRIFPGSDRAKALAVQKAELDARMEEADRSILESRVMTTDQYKGKDAEELKKMVRSIAIKAYREGVVLKVNITSPAWKTESVVEWTDTTQTALRHRTTDFLYAQVAVKVGGEVVLCTVYLNKDKIGGKENPLTGHIMYKDRLLEKNIR